MHGDEGAVQAPATEQAVAGDLGTCALALGQGYGELQGLQQGGQPVRGLLSRGAAAALSALQDFRLKPFLRLL